MNTFASLRIRDLALAKLAGRQIDVVGFVDDLLAVAREFGAIHCCLASERALRFELTHDAECEVELDSARSKLRMLCARLGVLCNETPGATASLYGGEGRIRSHSNNGSADESAVWAIRFKNTPGEQEFSILPVLVKNASAAVGE